MKDFIENQMKTNLQFTLNKTINGFQCMMDMVETIVLNFSRSISTSNSSN